MVCHYQSYNLLHEYTWNHIVVVDGGHNAVSSRLSPLDKVHKDQRWVVSNTCVGNNAICNTHHMDLEDGQAT
jgi:hypothetical protein